MDTEYMSEIEKSLALLNGATRQNWEHGRTGGNCDAFTMSIAGKGYYMITGGDANAPLLDEWDSIVLGWYEDDEDGFSLDDVVIEHVTNLETLTEWAGKLYRVIETQDHTEPIEEWSHVADFATEELAQAFMDTHYQTQVFTDEDDYNPATDCHCETCAGGWRTIDAMSLVVRVVKS